MNNPDTILGQFGYIYTGSCRCDGFFTKKYRKPGTQILIKWRVARMLFKIIKDNTTVQTWKNITNLEQILNELAAQNV